MFQKGKEKFLSEARTLARFNRQEGVVSVTDFFETNNTAYIVMEFLDGITLKQYTVNELVDMAKRFARKRQYEVDDDALLELYLKIDKLHSVNDNIKLDDIKEISTGNATLKREHQESSLADLRRSVVNEEMLYSLQKQILKIDNKI